MTQEEEREQAADKYVFGFHPSIQRMCKECYIDGAKWQKEQIMKDAIKGTVDWLDGPFLNFTQKEQDDALERIGAKIGDKVKIVIIKDEQQ